MQSTEEWQIARENRFNSIKYWQDRYASGGNSGAGSYGAEAIMKANVINHWIKEHGIKTITELGSGDANNLLLYYIPISYCGYDVSPKAVEISNERTRKIPNSLKYYFTSDKSKIDFDSDLCLSLDVWYHLVEDDVFNDYCKMLFVEGNWKYIIAYTTDTDIQFTIDNQPLSEHLRYRKFLDKVAEYPEWEVLYWISGFNTTDGKQLNFPSDKRFFLLKRKNA